MTIEMANPLLGRKLIQVSEAYDPFDHYGLNTGPTDEFGDLPEAPPTIRNIGWTLGNDCPYRCTHCYSMNARQKGANMTVAMIDRVVEQLALNGVETVNLGGNEPLFTNGANPRATLLPYIIEQLTDAGIIVGLTTSGITILRLYRDHRAAFDRLNDVDVSFDSPDERRARPQPGCPHLPPGRRVAGDLPAPRHAAQRDHVRDELELHRPQDRGALVALAKRYDANVRINPVKPVQPQHMDVALPPDMYYAGFARLMELCRPIDLGEPPIAAVTDFQGAKRCPCGRTSFRIHSITPQGEIHVSPCVYLHDYKAPLDLLEHDLADIIASPQFRVFRQRNANPDHVDGLRRLPEAGPVRRRLRRALLPLRLPRDRRAHVPRARPLLPGAPGAGRTVPAAAGAGAAETRLVHMDYLCTWIGQPR